MSPPAPDQGLRDLFFSALRATRDLFAMNVAEFAIRTVAQIILIRLFVPEIFGQYILLGSILALASLAASLEGRRYIVKHQGSRDSLSAAFSVEVVLAAAVTLLLLAFSGPILEFFQAGEIHAHFAAYSLFVLTTPLLLPQYVLQSRLDFRTLAIFNTASVSSEVVLSIILALTGFGLWAFVLGGLLGRAVSIVLIIGKVGLPPFRITRQAFRDLGVFGLPIWGAAVVMMVYNHLDNVMVSRILGVAALGVYAVADQIPNYLLLLVNKLGDITYPAFTRIRQSASATLAAMEYSTKLSAVVFLFPTSVAIVFGHEIVEIVFGAQWGDAVLPFIIFMLLVSFRGTFRYWADVATARGDTKLIFFASVGVLALMVVGGFILTPMYGIVGMAVAVTASFLAVSPLYLIYANRTIGIRYTRLLWTEGFGLGLAVAAGFAVREFVPLQGIGILVLGTGVITTVYWVTVGWLNRKRLATLVENLRTPSTSEATRLEA